MPLFFIVTGLFISEYSFQKEETFCEWWLERARRDFKRLIIPALLTIAVILSVSCLFFSFPNSYFTNPAQLIWNSHPEKPFEYVNMLGNLWFLFALFFAKQGFYLVRQLPNKKLLPYVCLIIGAFTIILAQYVVFPLDISVGLSVLPFIWVGYFVKRQGGLDKGIIPRWAWLLVVIWAFYVFYGKLRVGEMHYSWGYLPDIIAAIGGTFLFYEVSKIIDVKTKYMSRCLSFLGVYSLLLICAPSIETYCFPMQYILPQMPFRSLAIIMGKVAWCAIFVYACLRIPLLRKLFSIKAS